MLTQVEICAYIKEIKPEDGYTDRLRQYAKAKNDLLPQCPWEQHPTIIRAICDRLGI